MGKPIPGHGSTQGRHDRVLTDHLGETLGAETPIERALGGCRGDFGHGGDE
jgi:hypothetical protein